MTAKLPINVKSGLGTILLLQYPADNLIHPLNKFMHVGVRHQLTVIFFSENGNTPTPPVSSERSDRTSDV